MPERVNDQVILKELHDVPERRWSEVLTFIRSLKQRPPSTDRPVLSGADLAGSDLIGAPEER